MSARYLPSSPCLRAIINDDVPLGENAIADSNRGRLIAMTSGADATNRDWATMLLAQLDLNGPEVRAALLRAVSDEHASVRAEAVLGLARSDRAAALPFLQADLRGGTATMAAAGSCGHRCRHLARADLEAIAAPSGDPWLDSLVCEAIDACRSSAKQP